MAPVVKRCFIYSERTELEIGNIRWTLYEWNNLFLFYGKRWFKKNNFNRSSSQDWHFVCGYIDIPAGWSMLLGRPWWNRVPFRNPHASTRKAFLPKTYWLPCYWTRTTQYDIGIIDTLLEGNIQKSKYCFNLTVLFCPTKVWFPQMLMNLTSFKEMDILVFRAIKCPTTFELKT